MTKQFNEVYNTVINEKDTAKSVFKDIVDEDLLDDRREYDEDDLSSAYPELSPKDVKALYKMIQAAS